MSVPDEAESSVLPLDVVGAAARVLAAYDEPRVVVDDLAAEFARRLVGRLVSHHEIAHVRSEPGRGLDASGPLLLREVQFVDEAEPEHVLGTCMALIVPDRIPEPVRAELESSTESLDRLLTRHGIEWQVTLRPDEGYVADAAPARFSWLERRAGVVELLRMVSIAGRPAAILLDELPLPLPTRPAPALT